MWGSRLMQLNDSYAILVMSYLTNNYNKISETASL